MHPALDLLDVVLWAFHGARPHGRKHISSLKIRSAPVGYAAEYLILASLRLRMCISPLMLCRILYHFLIHARDLHEVVAYRGTPARPSSAIKRTSSFFGGYSSSNRPVIVHYGVRPYCHVPFPIPWHSIHRSSCYRDTRFDLVASAEQWRVLWSAYFYQ